MLSTASTFDDWDVVHKYAEPRSGYERDSFEKMEELAIRNGEILDILRVMSFLGDYDKNDFLSEVMAVHNDSLNVSWLVLNFIEPIKDAWTTAYYNLASSYEEEDIENEGSRWKNDILLQFLDKYDRKEDGVFVCTLMQSDKDSVAFNKGYDIAGGDF